jgi:hypothetical protein
MNVSTSRMNERSKQDGYIECGLVTAHIRTIFEIHLDGFRL